MYAYIRGILEEKSSDHIIIEAGGIGYFVYFPGNALSTLPEKGQELKIYTHYAVREDGVYLFGFPTVAEKELFELLISVSGIGPKGAMTILGSASVTHLYACITAGEIGSLTAVPGIGKKTAERIILELREKIKKITGEQPGFKGAAGAANGKIEEALQALLALGFPANKARNAIAALPTLSDSVTAEEIIRLALNALDEQRR